MSNDVDTAIAKVVLHAAYACIEELLQAADLKEPPSKALVLRCRRLLPRAYAHSFEALKTQKIPPTVKAEGISR